MRYTIKNKNEISFRNINSCFHVVLIQSMSGVEVDEEVGTLFNEMKLSSTNKYAFFKIENKEKVVVDKLGDPCVTTTKDDKKQFEKMKEEVFAKKEPRYILYDFGFTIKDGRKINKLALIFW